MKIDEVVLSYRDYYGTYHHHKEQMAYTAATLYLAAATGVIIHGTEVWAWIPPGCAVAYLLFFAAILGFSFVSWQLYYRALSADIVIACTSVATKLLTYAAESERPDVTPTTYRGLVFPKILVDELKSISQERGLISGSRIAVIITIFSMLVWSVLAYIAISK